MIPSVVVFDLDGVLFDTADLIRRAYRAAGVLPPEDVTAFEGIPWVAEQVGQPRVARVRLDKNTFYLREIADIVKTRQLPPFETATTLDLLGCPTVVMTGAPIGTLKIAEHALKDVGWPFKFMCDGIQTPFKMQLMGQMLPPGVYVDDQTRLVDVPLGWRFVHYTGQTAQDLLEEIMKES